MHDRPVKQLLNELVFHPKTSTPHLHDPEAELDDPLRPEVTVSYAQSMDGYVASVKRLFNGELQPVPVALSCKQSLAMTHYIRAHHDAIVVGLETFLVDNPRLTARKLPENGGDGDSQVTNGFYEQQPVPVVICPDILSTVERIRKSTGPHQHEQWHLFSRTEKQPNHARPIFVINSHCPAKANSKSTEPPSLAEHRLHVQNAMVDLVKFGAHVVTCPPDPAEPGHCDLKHAFRILKQDFNCRRVMVEGGAKLISSLLKQRLFDSLIITVCPVFLLHGVKCPQTMAAITAVPEVDGMMRFANDCVEYVRVGCDNVVVMKPKR